MIIMLVGPSGTGKSTLAAALSRDFGTKTCSTSAHLRDVAKDMAHAAKQTTRLDLGIVGDSLDVETGHSWVSDLVKFSRPSTHSIVVDAVLKPQQAIRIAHEFPTGQVVLVRLTAPDEVLGARVAARDGDRGVPITPEWGALDLLVRVVTVDATAPAEQVAAEVAVRSGLLASGQYGLPDRWIDCLTGGQYGSEGKGHIAHFIADQYGLLVRSGGANAGHQTWGPGEPYCFHHLPSGTRVNPRAEIQIAPGAVIRPDALLREIRECGAEKRTFIDPQAMIVEDWDVERERELIAAIGSTGQGVGSATSRRILRRLAEVGVRQARDCEELRPMLREARVGLERCRQRGEYAFLEGTQGFGLSILHGDYPYVTSRDTATGGLLSECGISPFDVRRSWIVCRTRPIRVKSPEGGTSGTMYKETSWEEIAEVAGVDPVELKRKELTSTTRKQRRVGGAFDWELFLRAVQINRPTDIALTFADYISPLNAKAKSWGDLTEETLAFIRSIEAVGVPVSLVSVGFGPNTILENPALGKKRAA